MTRRFWRSVGIAAVGLGMLTAASSATAPSTRSEAKGIGARFCKQKTTLGDLLPCKAAKASGAPIKIGMINTLTAPTGAFPELTQAVEAAVAWTNAELGGVDGSPIELIACDTKFSPEGSQTCAQQMVQEEVAAVMGGIDIFSTAMAILEQNNIPYIGGIPAAFEQVKSPISFQFSGGTWGAGVAFAHYAVKRLGAKQIGIMYADFGSIKNAAIEYSADVAKALGAKDVTLVPFGITATDFLAPLVAANEGDPDAIFVFAADTACLPVMKAARDLGIQARIVMTGACAAPKTTTAAGAAAEGVIFNVEGPVLGTDIDTKLYTAVLKKYAKGLDAAGAGTVSFRSFVNLWIAMRNLGTEAASSQAIIDYFRASDANPSFMGHPYTCDGAQIPEFPALCAPQQIVVEYRGGKLVQVTKKWVDVTAILARTT